MEGFEVGKRDDNISMIKKRRTKRPRHHDTSSSVSSFSDNSGGFDHRSPSNDSDIELSQRVEEEEDMAKCLMLLSQGHIKKPPLPRLSPLPAPSCYSRPSPSAAAGINKEIYECKTCNRIFPSFQALGGHRASHRKPKAAEHQESADVTTLSLQIPGHVVSSPPRNIINKSPRIHECSICGAEFSSGQALGGHMRRHRPLPSIAATNSGSHEESSDQEIKKPRNLLALDLNLPAPEDDQREISKFPFASKEQVIVFSASPLVDCHY